MKYIVCQNSTPGGKYYRGRQCYDKVLVDNNAVSAICWKCMALLTPPEEKKSPTGYPRGWKFMIEFVDKDGNVYHKGILQEHLFGTLPPTEIKESKKSKKSERKKDTLDDKVVAEFKKRVSKKIEKKSVSKKTPRVVKGKKTKSKK